MGHRIALVPQMGHANRAAPHLTQRLVNEINPGDGKLRIADREVRGLFLRVMPSGAKSYVVRISKDGRRGEAAIGDARSITLAAARARAIDVVAAKGVAVSVDDWKFDNWTPGEDFTSDKY